MDPILRAIGFEIPEGMVIGAPSPKGLCLTLNEYVEKKFVGAKTITLTHAQLERLVEFVKQETNES